VKKVETAASPDGQERDLDDMDKDEFFDAVDTSLNDDERVLLLTQNSSPTTPPSCSTSDTTPVYATSGTSDPALPTPPSPPQVASVETQTTYTMYPEFVNNDIKREVVLLQRVVSAFPGRLRMARCHEEIRREIEFLAEKVRSFMKYHRTQVTNYTQCLVMEGHRQAVSNELRKSSNECLMPLLDILDKMRSKNVQLASVRGPLNSYRGLVDELLECRGLIQLIIQIVPEQLLM
jgi:hypothetical protein